MDNEITQYFIRLHREDYELIKKAIEPLSDEQIWNANPEGVSVGNMICHTCEMEQFWIDWGLCGEPFDRDRQIEFDRHADLSKAALIKRLDERCAATEAAVNNLSEEQWLAEREFHGDPFTGAGILVWHVRHVGLHRGHIQAHCRWQTAKH